MGSPFAIWTMRRTGGTTLANVLANIGSYSIEHEPFNWDRSFGEISRGFRNNRSNFPQLMDGLRENCFTKKICVKHCYEISGHILNDSLVKAFSESGYKQIFWYRENELLRLLSLYTAEQTSVWGKHGSKDVYTKYLSGTLKLAPYDIDKMKSHFELCRKATLSIRESISDSNKDIRELSYEKLYSGGWENRKELLKSLCYWLEFEPEGIEEHLEKCKSKLMSDKQDSFQLYSLIPNINEIRQEFSDFTFD